MRCEHNVFPRARIRLRERAQRGLTLVELLIAISVLAVVAVLGWRGLDTIVRARVSLTDDLEQTRGLQLSFAQMQNDCAQIASPALLLSRQPLQVDQGRVTLVRTVQTEGQPIRVQVVSYLIRDGVLTRRETVPTRDLTELDNQLASTANGVESGYAVSLQKGVDSLATRLWADDNQGWRSADTLNDSNRGSVSPAAAVPTDAAASAKGQVMAQAAAAQVQRPSYTGLELTLRLAGRTTPLQKVFLLGSV